MLLCLYSVQVCRSNMADSQCAFSLRMLRCILGSTFCFHIWTLQCVVVWTACTPSLEDLGQAGVDVSLGVDCLLLMERNRGHMTGFGSENRDRPFGGASRSLEFHRWGWALPWETEDCQTEDCCLVSGSYWHTKVSLPVTMSQTCCDLPPSNFR